MRIMVFYFLYYFVKPDLSRIYNVQAVCAPTPGTKTNSDDLY